MCCMVRWSIVFWLLAQLLAAGQVRAGRRGIPLSNRRGSFGGPRGEDSSRYISLGRLSLGGEDKDEFSFNSDDNDMTAWRDIRATAAQRYTSPKAQIDLEEILLASAVTAAKPSKRPCLSRFLPFGSKRQSKSPTKAVDASTINPGGLDHEALAMAATQPLIPEDVWEQLTGDEFDDPKAVDALAQTGYNMATQHTNNEWVDWQGSIPSDLDAVLDDGLILVYRGNARKPGYGDEVPWIKSISMVPMAPGELAELMMDSSRVKTYNKLSLGRDDIKVFDTDDKASSPRVGSTKIVRNVVQLPVSNNKVESVTLLHTRELDNGAHLLVSRAIGGGKYSTGAGKNYILLGVNLFEPIQGDPNECRMTAINHVYSPGVPIMLAGKVGVSSAKNFVKDIRALRISVKR